MKRLLIPAALALLLAACSSTPDSSDKAGGAPVETRGGSGGVTTVTTGGVESRGLPAVLTDPTSILSKRSVYFDFDSYEVKSEYKDLVTAHAKFLTDNRQFKMLIQGNTDERGSREYNIALGERRANAVRQTMIAMGVSPQQIRVVSFGEERPAAAGHDERSYALNRRVEIIY